MQKLQELKLQEEAERLRQEEAERLRQEEAARAEAARAEAERLRQEEAARKPRCSSLKGSRRTKSADAKVTFVPDQFMEIPARSKSAEDLKVGQEEDLSDWDVLPGSADNASNPSTTATLINGAVAAAGAVGRAATGPTAMTLARSAGRAASAAASAADVTARCLYAVATSETTATVAKAAARTFYNTFRVAATSVYNAATSQTTADIANALMHGAAAAASSASEILSEATRQFFTTFEREYAKYKAEGRDSAADGSYSPANDLRTLMLDCRVTDAQIIKTSYRRLVFELHPDKNVGKPEGVLEENARRCARVTAAYDNLKEHFKIT